jgi:hypothetical protein
MEVPREGRLSARGNFGWQAHCGSGSFPMSPGRRFMRRNIGRMRTCSWRGATAPAPELHKVYYYHRHARRYYRRAYRRGYYGGYYRGY